MFTIPISRLGYEAKEALCRNCKPAAVETKNNQQQNVRWAKDYTFASHIEELGRMRKEMELVGLEPTTSAMPSQRSSN